MIDLLEQSKNKQISLKISNFENLKLTNTFDVSPEDFKFIVHDTPKSPNGSLFQKELTKYGVTEELEQSALINELISRLGLIDSTYTFDRFTSSSDKVDNLTNCIDFNKEFLFWYVKHNGETNLLGMFVQGLRDALCHGNLYLDNGFYFLCSTSVKDKKSIKFGLQIKSLEKISLIVQIFKNRLNSTEDSCG